MTDRVRIAHFSGVRYATLIERAGDWALTREDEHPPRVTHLPTGLSLSTPKVPYASALKPLLHALAALPSADLQSLDLALVNEMAASLVK
jgi:hypothetical protein